VRLDLRLLDKSKSPHSIAICPVIGTAISSTIRFKLVPVREAAPVGSQLG